MTNDTGRLIEAEKLLQRAVRSLSPTSPFHAVELRDSIKEYFERARAEDDRVGQAAARAATG